jgi:hypothetical protein
VSAILGGSSFPETAAIQYNSVLKHLKLKLYNIIKYAVHAHAVWYTIKKQITKNLNEEGIKK